MARTSLLSDARFYDRREYFAELQRSAKQAKPGDRITVMTMAFSPASTEISDLMAALGSAARRGVHVRMAVDAHNLIIDGSRPGPLWYDPAAAPATFKGSFKAFRDSLESLKAAGGSYHIINQPVRRFSNPYGGRSHIKLALVNDRVFLGGCNLQQPDHMDIMVGWQDAATAGWLDGMVGRITGAASARQGLDDTDIEHRVDDTAAIFVDAGVERQSLILQQAYRLIDEAEEFVTITCQYFPGGKTAQHLLKAHKRGVKVTVYFSPPATHGGHAPAHWLHNSIERLRLPDDLFAHQMPADNPHKLHAKILLSEKAALIGSHNYVQAGVNFGTAEIALRVADAKFIGRAAQHIAKLVTTS